jgi:hypothetical protein
MCTPSAILLQDRLTPSRKRYTKHIPGIYQVYEKGTRKVYTTYMLFPWKVIPVIYQVTVYTFGFHMTGIYLVYHTYDMNQVVIFLEYTRYHIPEKVNFWGFQMRGAAASYSATRSGRQCARCSAGSTSRPSPLPVSRWRALSP